MLDSKGDMAYPPVRWVQQDAAETEDLAEEFSQADELIGSNWHLAYGLADSQLISSLYERLKQHPNADDQRRLAIYTVAAFHVLHQDNDLFVPGTLEVHIERAMMYLSAPSPWLAKEVGFHVDLAHSAHFILDPIGFANLQRALSVDHKDLAEVASVAA